MTEPDGRAASAGSRGLELLYGIGCEPDAFAALDLLHEADALGGSPEADYVLALVALGDVLVRRDPVRIARWLARSAQRGFTPALRSAALVFSRCLHQKAQDDAVWCLKQASAHGDAIASALLAHRLAEGRGMPRDPGRATQLMRSVRRAGVAMEWPYPLLERGRDPSAADTDTGAVDQEPDWSKLTLSLSLMPGDRTRLCDHPHIERVDQLLDVEECRLVRYCGSVHLGRSLVADPLTGQALSASLRTSRSASFPPGREDVSLRLLQLRFAEAAGGVPLTHFEPLVVLHYAPGEQYRPHRDYLPPSDPTLSGPGRQRFLTLCCYLNEGMKGGATAFPEVGLRVTPQQGSAVIFANLHADGQPDPASLHAGEPVEFGEKWLATTWIRQGPVRPF